MKLKEANVSFRIVSDISNEVAMRSNFRNLRKDNTKSVNLEEGGLLKVSKVPKVSPY
jgi:hypothetical protein